MSKLVRNLLILLTVFIVADVGLLFLLFNKKGDDKLTPESQSPLAQYLATSTTTTTTAVTAAAPSETTTAPPESVPDSQDPSSNENSTPDSQPDDSSVTEEPQAAIYTLTEDAPLLSDGLKEIYYAYKGDNFTGVPDAEKPDYIRVDYMYDTKLISKDKVAKREKSVALHTGAVGQRGGSIDGFSACGPTGAAIMVDWEKGEKTTKDELITYTRQHELDNQGSVTSQSGGMTSDKVIELINTFYEGKYVAKNVYNDLPTAKLTELINTGHRALISVRYTGKVVEDWPTALVHFVIVCAYEDADDGRYFYYADPFYGQGGRSLTRSSASLIETSMKNVKDEPQTIMILE